MNPIDYINAREDAAVEEITATLCDAAARHAAIVEARQIAEDARAEVRRVHVRHMPPQVWTFDELGNIRLTNARRRCLRMIARSFHPSDPAAAERMVQVNEARMVEAMNR